MAIFPLGFALAIFNYDAAKKDLRQERNIYHFIKKQQQNGIDTNPFKYVYLYLETASR